MSHWPLWPKENYLTLKIFQVRQNFVEFLEWRLIGMEDSHLQLSPPMISTMHLLLVRSDLEY